MQHEFDLAGLDTGIQLYESADSESTTESRLSQVRVWIQAKGIQETTLSAAQIDTSDTIPVSGLSVDQVLNWYDAAEPVYLAVYLEAIDLFLAEDIRTLVDTSHGREQLAATLRAGQQTVTLRVPLNATLEHALQRMPRHRSMRIDSPPFRGRQLGHRYDPLRSELQRLDPPLFEEVVNQLLAAHDFRRTNEVPLGEMLGAEVGPVKSFVGTLHLTYEWINPFFTQFGYDASTDFRPEAASEQIQGKVLIIVHSDPAAQLPSPNKAIDALKEDLRQGGVQGALVFFNESDLELFGAWRSVLQPLTKMPLGLGSLSFSVLTTTSVFLEFRDRLSWSYLNVL